MPCADQTIANQDWVKFLLIDNQGEIRKALLPFFPDQRHALIITRLQGNASIEQEGRGADYTIATMKPVSFPHATIVTGGAAVLLNDINKYLKGGMLLLGGIAVAIMIVILLVLFDVRWRLLPLGIVLIGVIWAFGLAGYLGIPLTLVTISGLPVMLGIGIDYSIQMHARVEEEVVIDHSEHPIQESARNLGPALLVVTFDAIFAFAALRFSKVPMIRSFGLLLAVGVAAICFCSIAGTLSALGIREYRSPTKRRDYREGPLGRLVVWLGSLTWKVAPFLAVAALIVFVGGVLVENKLEIQTDPIEWVNPSSQAVQTIHKIERQAGISSELGMYVVSKDAFSDKSVKFMDGFTTEQLCRYGDAARAPEQCPADAKAVPPDKRVLANASSIVSIVSFLTEVPGTRAVPPTGAQVKQVFESAPPGIQKSTVSKDGKASNLIFATTPASLAKRAVVVKEIRKRLEPPAGIRATPSGLAVVGVGLLDNLESNRILLTYLAITFVFLFLAIRLRSIIRSLLSLVPVLIAVGAASLFAYFAGFTLSPMTAVGGPLVVAACTEFTSLILLRFVEERRRGLEPRDAVDVAAARTGRAFIVSGLTAISGVAVLSASSLPLLRDFGVIVAVNVAVALLERAGRAPAHARLGRSSQLGVARPREAPGGAVDPGRPPRARRGAGRLGAGREQSAVHDRTAPRSRERAQARAAVVAERRVGRDRSDVGRILDPLPLRTAGLRERELVAGLQDVAGAKILDRRVPLRVGPGACRREHRAGHVAGGHVGDRRLQPGQSCGHERGDVTVPAVLAQQRLRVPEHEVVVVGPGERDVPGEEWTTLHVGARGLGGPPGQGRGLGELG